jgi:hypothetical protein
MTDADFLSITDNGRLCDAEGALRRREFEEAMRAQVKLHFKCAPELEVA